jgi:hypothetical protein
VSIVDHDGRRRYRLRQLDTPKHSATLFQNVCFKRKAPRQDGGPRQISPLRGRKK